MRLPRVIIGSAVISLAAIALVGCSSSTDSEASSDKPIKIGAILELTGNASVYGVEAKQAIDLYLDEIDHKIDGRPVEIVYKDDASDPATAVAKARELVEKDKVDVTFGPIFSDAQDAIAPYLAEQNLLAMAPIGGNWALHEHGNWIVYPGTLESFCDPAGTELANAGKKTMTTIGADYVAGHQFVDPPAASFKAAGGEVLQQQWVPLGTADFGPYITSLKPADMLVAWTIMPDEAVLINTFFQYQKDSTTELFLCEADNITNAQLTEIGAELLGTRGMIAAYTSGIDNEANKKFVAAIQERYDTSPTMSHGTAYVTFGALVEGLKATGGDADVTKLHEAISGLSLDTVAGPLEFSKNGFGVTSRYFAEVAEADGEYFWQVTEELPKVRDTRDSD